MPKFISDEDMDRLDPPKKGFISDDEMNSIEAQETSFGDKAKSFLEDNIVDQLPALGAAGGGTVGGVMGLGAGGVGAVPGALGGAGIGGYLGKAAQNLYNTSFRPEKAPQDSLQYLSQPLSSGAEGVAAEGLGMGIGNAVSKLPSVKQSVANSLKKRAEESAFKAAGADKRAFRQALEDGHVHDVGRQLLDDKIVTPFATPKNISERSGLKLDQKGKEIESILGALQAAEAKLNVGGVTSGVDRKAIAKQLRKELVSDNLDIPGITAKNKKVSKLISEFEFGGDKKIGVLDAEMKKRATGKEINYDRLPGADIPLEEQVQRSLYTNLKRGVEDAADVLEKNVGGPSAGKFKSAKNAFENIKTAKRVADKRVAGDAANRVFGLTDTIGGATGATIGAMLGGPAGAAAGTAIGGIANKLARTYATPLKATSYDALSKLLGSSPKTKSLVPLLEDAASRGPEALKTTLRILSHRPEFQQMLEHNPEVKAIFRSTASEGKGTRR